ncbi:MAG: leucine-rich repeat protein [Fusicatenibacter sp.]|nr:leucine-rich repeat domain-containing protein [Fusicatenibacter sp.]
MDREDQKMERGTIGKVQDADQSQSFLYEIRRDHVIIWRCFSGDVCAVVPKEIEGYPVKELAPYAFSEHQDPADRKNKIRSEGVLGNTEELPMLCGGRLEEIILPETLERVGRYCFYNCENLKRISFCGGIRDWGSGTFTGCHRIHSLEVRMDEEGKSTWKDVLSEIREELDVDYFCGGGENTKYAKLVFPEFFEEGVENTPARILETHVHGSGLYYRNCFVQRVFQFGEYDSRFDYAAADESRELLLRMAIGRLRYPYQLSEKAKRTYGGYLCRERSAAAKEILRLGDPEALLWFLEYLQAEKEELTDADKQALLDEMKADASRCQNPWAISRLMDFEHKNRPKKEYDPFEL